MSASVDLATAYYLSKLNRVAQTLTEQGFEVVTEDADSWVSLLGCDEWIAQLEKRIEQAIDERALCRAFDASQPQA